MRFNESGSSLASLASGHDRAASSARDHAAAEDRAAASSRDSAGAHDRSAASVRDHAAASDRAVSSVGDHADASDRAASSARDQTTATDRATSSVRDNASASDHAASSARGHAKASEEASGSVRGLAAEAERASKGLFNAGDASDVVSGGLGAMGKAAETATFSAMAMGKGLFVTGAAGVVAAAGMGILAAATAGIGVAGVFGDIAKSAPLMNEARKGMAGFSHEFAAMSGASAAAGLGPMKGLAATVKDLGHELAAVGVANMGSVLGGASQLVGATTAAIQKLEPAIGPATTAATALGKAVIGAFGNSGAAITSFSDTVTAQSPGIQAGLEGLITTAGEIGEVAVKAVGHLGPSMGSDSGFAAAAGMGNFLKSISPKWLQDASDAVDSALGVTVSDNGDVTVGGAKATSSSGFGTGAGSTPHATGPKPGATDASGAPRDFAPGEFQGSSFGWHMPAGAAPIVAGQSNDMSGVVSDMSGSNAPEATKPAAPKAAEAPKAEAPPPAATTGREAGAVGPQDKAPPPPPPLTGIGSGGTSGPTVANAQAVAAALATIPPAAAAAGASGAQMGSQLGSSLADTASKAQSSTADVKSSMGSVQQAAAAPPPPPPPPPPPAAPPPPPPPAPAAAAIQKATAAAVQESAPQASAGGSSVGASIGEGMGEGITKTITNTLTIVKKWVVRIVETAATGLDAHSPSRIFVGLGASIPQGLAVGVQAESGKALAATQNMISQVVKGSQAQLAAAQGPLAKAAQNGVTAPINAQPGMGGKYGAQTDEQKKKEEEKRQNQAKADNKANSEKDRRAALEKLGYSKGTIDRVIDREDEHKKRAEELKAGRTRDANNAIDRLHGKDPANRDPNAPSAWDERKNAILGRAATNKTNAQDLLKDPNWNGAKTQAQTEGQNIGKGLQSGLAEGVNKGSGQSKEAADKAAGQVVEQTKKKLGVKSPSTVYREIGGNLMEGWTDGIRRGRRDLDREFDDIDRDMHDRGDRESGWWGKNGYGPPGASKGGGGGGGGGGSSGGGGGGHAAGGVDHSYVEKAPAGMHGRTRSGEGGTEWHVDSDGKIISGKDVPIDMKTGLGGFHKTVMEGFIPAGFYADAGGKAYQHFRIAYNAAADAAAGGFGSEVTPLFNGVLPIADSTGLLAGQVWGRSIITGVDQTLKKADFQSSAVPAIDSALAKTALGVAGLLGPAGSGASINKVPTVTLGGGTATTGQSTATIHNHVYIDGKEIRLIAGQEVEATLGDLVSSISRQSG